MDMYSPIVTCPYNQSHQILKCRMPYHLVKCAKNYPNVHLEICPFDATHRMPKAEYLHHISVCPDRKLVEKHKYPSEFVHGALRYPVEDFEMDRFTEKWEDLETPGEESSTIGDYSVTDASSNYQDDSESSEGNVTEDGASEVIDCEAIQNLCIGTGRGLGRGASLLSMIKGDASKPVSADITPGSKTSSRVLASKSNFSVKDTVGGCSLEPLSSDNDYVAFDEDSYKFLMSWGRGKST